MFALEGALCDLPGGELDVRGREELARAHERFEVAWGALIRSSCKSTGLAPLGSLILRWAYLKPEIRSKGHER
jgi:hypothetical protein